MNKNEKKLFIHNVQNDDLLLKYILKFFDGNTLGRGLYISDVTSVDTTIEKSVFQTTKCHTGVFS